MIINSFLGIRNTSPIRSIPNNSLSSAVNVDIDDAGIITKRNGYTLSKTATITTAFSTAGQVGYLVSGGNLYRINSDTSLVLICSTTASDFYDVVETVFTNDGLKIFDISAVSLYTPIPQNAPQIVSVAGDLPAGIYSAVCVNVASSGLESGASPVSTVELTSAGGLQIITDDPPAGFTTKIYVTDAGGDIFYGPDGVPIHDKQITSDCFPVGCDVVSYFNNSVYASQSLPSGKSVIWWSAPYHYQWWDYSADYLIVPGVVRDMAATPEALIIGTDIEIYALDQSGLHLLDVNGVPNGRSFTVDGDKVLMHTHLGVCEALPFKNMTEKKVSLAPGEHCSTAIVEQNGISRFVTLTDGSGVPYNART